MRSSGLRPTKQRVKSARLLFDRDKTFHFTVNDLAKISNDLGESLPLATVYNTVHAFKNAGYLREIDVR